MIHVNKYSQLSLARIAQRYSKRGSNYKNQIGKVNWSPNKTGKDRRKPLDWEVLGTIPEENYPADRRRANLFFVTDSIRVDRMGFKQIIKS